MFSGLMGLGTIPGASISWKGFCLAWGKDCDTLILASALRHDLDSGCLCLDCHVVPLTNERILYISEALVDVVAHKRLLDVRVDQHEEISWKRVLPSLVERCRTSWNHIATCEYRKEFFRCPLSVVHGQSPVCTCGQVHSHAAQGFPRVFSLRNAGRHSNIVSNSICRENGSERSCEVRIENSIDVS